MLGQAYLTRKPSHLLLMGHYQITNFHIHHNYSHLLFMVHDQNCQLSHTSQLFTFVVDGSLSKYQLSHHLHTRPTLQDCNSSKFYKYDMM